MHLLRKKPDVFAHLGDDVNCNHRSRVDCSVPMQLPQNPGILGSVKCLFKIRSVARCMIEKLIQILVIRIVKFSLNQMYGLYKQVQQIFSKEIGLNGSCDTASGHRRRPVLVFLRKISGNGETYFQHMHWWWYTVTPCYSIVFF